MIDVRLVIVLLTILALANLVSADFVEDFFPVMPEERIAFDIGVSYSGALVQNVIYWHQENRTVRQLIRREINVPNPDEKYLLSFVPDKLTDLPDGLPDSLGRRGRPLHVDRDQLGLYKQAAAVFLVQPPNTDCIFEVCLYDGKQSPVEDFEGYGWSAKLLLAKPGSDIPTLTLDDQEYEQYVVDTLEYGAIYVVRRVLALEDSTSSNGVTFSEEMIFKRSTGLVSLVQGVEGDATHGMDWQRQSPAR